MDTEVFLASDGRALALLRKEYPELPVFELPGYNVKYKGKSMTRSIAAQLPKISRAIWAERKAIGRIVEKEHIDVVISDNRYGCRNNKTKNIFITHQINIATPNKIADILVNKINHQFINRFDECWIPDFEGETSLAGKLSKALSENQKYIGPLSRFNFTETDLDYQLLVVLSGPEPQRSHLEKIILEQLMDTTIKALIVQGKTEQYEERKINDNISLVSYLTSDKLNSVILKSEIVLARSGYSTIMDLAKVGKPAILIPTPGQTEQEYLADRLMTKGLFYASKQSSFNLKTALSKANSYTGFSLQNNSSKLLEKRLQSLF